MTKILIIFLKQKIKQVISKCKKLTIKVYFPFLTLLINDKRNENGKSCTFAKN